MLPFLLCLCLLSCSEKNNPVAPANEVRAEQNVSDFVVNYLQETSARLTWRDSSKLGPFGSSDFYAIYLGIRQDSMWQVAAVSLDSSAVTLPGIFMQNKDYFFTIIKHRGGKTYPMLSARSNFRCDEPQISNVTIYADSVEVDYVLPEFPVQQVVLLRLNRQTFAFQQVDSSSVITGRLVHKNLFHPDSTYSFRIYFKLVHQVTPYSASFSSTLVFVAPAPPVIGALNEDIILVGLPVAGPDVQKVFLLIQAGAAMVVVDSVNPSAQNYQFATPLLHNRSYVFALRYRYKYGYVFTGRTVTYQYHFEPITQFTLENLSESGYLLRWNSAPPSANYTVVIERAIAPQYQFVPFRVFNSQITSYPIEHPVGADSLVNYRIHAVGNYNTGSYLTVSRKLTLKAPGNFRFSNVSDIGLEFSWQNEEPEQQYVVLEVSVNDTLHWAAFDSVQAPLSSMHHFQNLTSDETTYFRIRCKIRYNYSPYSPVLSFSASELAAGYKLVFVQGSSFFMGSANGAIDERPVHRVELASFYMGATEVTQRFWKAIMGAANNPSALLGDSLPVTNVSYNDIKLFLAKLNQATGKQYILPTEAQWEFSATGGVKTAGTAFSGNTDPVLVAWYTANSSGRAHECALLLPNELGLFDMSGNVWEWCSDYYGADYYSNSVGSNPPGPGVGNYFVQRGGAFNLSEYFCRIAKRNWGMGNERLPEVGFRISRWL